jgi:hypothetical protein
VTRRWYTLWTVAITAWAVEARLVTFWNAPHPPHWQVAVVCVVSVVAGVSTLYCIMQERPL